MSGPPPKPTALKMIDGNPGRTPINKDEVTPEIPTEVPPFPDGLCEGARPYWEELAPMLFRIRCMTEAERQGLSTLCVALFDFHDVQKMIDKFGRVVMTPSGVPKVSPYIQIRYQAMALVIRLLQEFGLTPASRSRIIMAGGNVNKGKTNAAGENKDAQAKNQILARRIK